MSSRVTVGELKPVEGKPYDMRKVRRYRKRVAEIHSYKGVRRSILWVYATTADYKRATERWRVPNDIVSVARNFGLTHVGLSVEDGTLMLTSIATCSWNHPPEVIKEMSNGGCCAYLVPEQLFAIRKPPEDNREEALIKRMKIGGRK